jgi:hypothetical protein
MLTGAQIERRQGCVDVSIPQTSTTMEEKAGRWWGDARRQLDKDLDCNLDQARKAGQGGELACPP